MWRNENHQEIYNQETSLAVGSDSSIGFDVVKTTIAKEVVLAYPDFSKPFVYTDASTKQLGAVITQDNRPIMHRNLTRDALGLTSDRVYRWRLLLEEYAPEIFYIKGIHSTVADATSRLEYNPMQNDK